MVPIAILSCSYQEDDSAKISSNLQMPLCHLIAIRYDDCASRASETVDNVAAEKPGSSKDRNGVSSKG